jgi:hypothetical protein
MVVDEQSPLSPNHWRMQNFSEILTKKQYQRVLDVDGLWVFRNGKKANIRSSYVGPGRYLVWLEDED